MGYQQSKTLNNGYKTALVPKQKNHAYNQKPYVPPPPPVFHKPKKSPQTIYDYDEWMNNYASASPQHFAAGVVGVPVATIVPDTQQFVGGVSNLVISTGSGGGGGTSAMNSDPTGSASKLMSIGSIVIHSGPVPEVGAGGEDNAMSSDKSTTVPFELSFLRVIGGPLDGTMKLNEHHSTFMHYCNEGPTTYTLRFLSAKGMVKEFGQPGSTEAVYAPKYHTDGVVLRSMVDRYGIGKHELGEQLEKVEKKPEWKPDQGQLAEIKIGSKLTPINAFYDLKLGGFYISEVALASLGWTNVAHPDPTATVKLGLGTAAAVAVYSKNENAYTISEQQIKNMGWHYLPAKETTGAKDWLKVQIGQNYFVGVGHGDVFEIPQKDVLKAFPQPAWNENFTQTARNMFSERLGEILNDRGMNTGQLAFRIEACKKGVGDPMDAEDMAHILDELIKEPMGYPF